MKSIVTAITLSVAALAASAQSAASGPSASASAPKHKWVQKLKNHRPASSAVNPEASADKKGGA